jgi:hypothetical protein
MGLERYAIIKGYKCQICNYETPSYTEMSEHLEKKHEETVKKVSYNVICEYKYIKKEDNE